MNKKACVLCILCFVYMFMESLHSKEIIMSLYNFVGIFGLILFLLVDFKREGYTKKDKKERSYANFAFLYIILGRQIENLIIYIKKQADVGIIGIYIEGVLAFAILAICECIRFLFPNAKIVFALSTAVIEEWELPEFVRYNHEIEEYNQKAREVMEELGVEVNDLYSITSVFDHSLYADAVHFNEEGSKVLADAVIKACLPEIK